VRRDWRVKLEKIGSMVVVVSPEKIEFGSIENGCMKMLCYVMLCDEIIYSGRVFVI